MTPTRGHHGRRDPDEQPEPDGVKRGYYESLPHPYTIRNGPLRTVRELLLVRGVTPELFHGEDTNANGRLHSNEETATAIRRTMPTGGWIAGGMPT